MVWYWRLFSELGRLFCSFIGLLLTRTPSSISWICAPGIRTCIHYIPVTSRNWGNFCRNLILVSCSSSAGSPHGRSACCRRSDRWLSIATATLTDSCSWPTSLHSSMADRFDHSSWHSGADWACWRVTGPALPAVARSGPGSLPRRSTRTRRCGLSWGECALQPPELAHTNPKSAWHWANNSWYQWQ